MKLYIHKLADAAIVTAANLKTVADTNPSQYPVGAEYVTVAGVRLVITANTGSAVTVKTVTVTP